MNSTSLFESRSGKLSCTAKELYGFVTDVRNFEQLIPSGSIDNWQADKESCKFGVSMIGSVDIKLTDKVEYKKVVFRGNAFKKNEFSLFLNINDNGDAPAEVNISIETEMDPIMKMMASKPIDQFLQKLIDYMEEFRGWKGIKV
jgi:carbon monoxide dehydrogenase subunit G